MLQCCSHPVDSRLPAALPCQLLCRSFSSLRSILPRGGLPPGQPAQPFHPREAASGSCISPPGHRAGRWGWEMGLLGLQHWDLSWDWEHCQQQESSSPYPLPLPSPKRAAWQAPHPAFLGQEERHAAPKPAVTLVLSSTSLRRFPRLTALHPRIPCLVSSGSPPLGIQPDAKTHLLVLSAAAEPVSNSI